MSDKDRQTVDHECELAESFIVAFLRESPNAADTIDGIARWWFEANQAPISMRVLQKALQRLAARGVLHGRVLPSGATLWSAAARPAGYDAGRAMSDE